MDQKSLKGSSYLLVHGLERLKHEQIDYPKTLLETNEPLYIAYILEEDLSRFRDSQNKHSAACFFVNWLDQAVDSGFKSFIKLALTLIDHFDGLFVYFKHRISSGALEGLNNKIKTLKRMAYGYRDLNFFILRLLFINESTYAITGRAKKTNPRYLTMYRFLFHRKGVLHRGAYLLGRPFIGKRIPNPGSQHPPEECILHHFLGKVFSHMSSRSPPVMEALALLCLYLCSLVITMQHLFHLEEMNNEQTVAL